VGDLARSLAELVAAEPLGDKQRCLIASLNLSLQRLPGDLLAVLPRLGVFQGGALEPLIFNITGFTSEQWQRLRLALEQTGLVQVEVLENITPPFLRFHPTLAPVLWGRLSPSEQADIRSRHQQAYYELVSYLLDADSQTPHEARSIARRELANLLWAVKGLLKARSEDAVAFISQVSKFLYFFGLKQDLVFLTGHLNQLVDIVGSNDWYLSLSIQGEQLFYSGQYPAAVTVFTEILQGLNSEQSFNRIKTLGLLGRCFRFLGQLIEATHCLQEALNLSAQLESSHNVKIQRGTCQSDLGDVLMDLGEFEKAKMAYQDALAIYEETGNLKGSAVTTGQMSILAMWQDDLITAIDLCHKALLTFQQLQEAEPEAATWHQLGMLFTRNQQWTDADCAYREAAKIFEQLGAAAGAASTYMQLGILNSVMNKPIEAENWYRKALQVYREVGDRIGESMTLHNLASLLAIQPNRLPEAHQLAIDALVIRQTLHPAVAKIWIIYELLAMIATAQNEPDKDKEYRYLARTTKSAFAGTQDELQQYAEFIELVIVAVGDTAAREQLLEPELVQMEENGWGQLVAEIRRVLAGEREVEVLWDNLDLDDSMIIAAILGRV
jgi:tetratricopeptide (TPR) repeat protein